MLKYGYSVVKHRSKRSGYSRASNIPGVTAPKKSPDEFARPALDVFGSGNAAPAGLIWLSGAIQIALFGLIIGLFEAEADGAVPSQAEPHI